MGDAPAFGCRANFNLCEIQFELAHGVRKIVRFDVGPVTSVPPVLKSKRRAGRGAGRLLHFETNTEGPVGVDGDVLIERSGPALIRIQRGCEVGSNTERSLTSGAWRRRIGRTAGEQ
jgi:hypothetical protein